MNGPVVGDRWNLFDWSELDLIKAGLELLHDSDAQSLVKEIDDNLDFLPKRKQRRPARRTAAKKEQTR